ncbi:MAG: DUF2336 domain-containing protein [Rhodospirillaceae bacterium]
MNTAAKSGGAVVGVANAPARDRLIHLLGIPGQRITYEQARDLLDHPEVEVRRALAERTDLEPEILFFLARDSDTAVRRSIAVNAATPDKASLLLAADEDADVRSDLAERVGRVLPGLDLAQQEKAWRTIHQVLILLARDQLPRVRRALSEALKSVPNAPHDVVFTLATDTEATVATPVLEFSPVLTDEDLKAVIQASPLTAQLVAISRRINVGEEVSNAIVGTGNVDAITMLLKNHSAQIREETLDAIIDAAPRQVWWHEPLVHRPNLNSRAALRIAEFVAASLVQELARRAELDADTIKTLDTLVKDKLRKDDSKGGLLSDDPSEMLAADALRMAARQVEAVARAGKLTTRAVMQMAADGPSPMIVASLAHLADLPLAAVAEVVRTASAKGMLAVAWAGDFTAEEAAQLQLKVARVTPESLIRPRAGGGFDATEAELEWQLDMFQEMAEK